jgi:1-deoxy-D-xylulose-5-phosphate reductoisomerase
MNKVKTVQIQGSTGSIGTQALSIIKEHPDKFFVETLSARNNWQLLAKQAIEFSAKKVIIEDDKYHSELKDYLKDKPIEVYAGRNSLIELASAPHDVTISGIVGIAALEPTLEAIKGSKIIGLANKESIICAGDIMLSEAAKHNSQIIPVDSEHSAIFQCLDNSEFDKIRKITLTASGGPFRNKSLEEMKSVTPEEAIKHPNWNMGGKVSVDSATLMNKGLELIEACKLFTLPVGKVNVVIHPESIIHGMVNYEDGSSIAQLSIPSMRTPISYALHYPNRLDITHTELDLASLSKLTFEEPDFNRFPLLKLAIDIAHLSQSEIVALNMANEVAVNAFLQHKIKFLDIHKLVSKVIDMFSPVSVTSIAEVITVSHEVYYKANSLIANL